MKNKLKKLFFPLDNATRWQKVMPYAILGLISIAILIGGNSAWVYTNSSEFCGTTCHTMPPEYSTYQVSPHARVRCVECHIGRGLFSTQFIRKAEDLRHVYLNVTKQFEYPIKATRMRPSEDACETCHFPEKFSDDSLREIVNYNLDAENSQQTIILIMKTGGGTSRDGLGYGIHWHVENQVDFYATDSDQQDIPYIRVIDADGNVKEFSDITSNFNVDEIEEDELIRMDCITCHNRITHNIPTPEEIVSLAINNDLIPVDLVYSAKQAVDALYIYDADKDDAIERMGVFADFYKENYPDIYAERSDEIDGVVETLRGIYAQYVFPDQNFFWDTHSNNLGHKDDPGCFRCHDGEHFTEEQEAVRLECNLCHTIPVVINEDDLVANIELVRGPEPVSHTDSYWIPIHSKAINMTCETCHDLTGVDLSADGLSHKPPTSDSFCGNEACHSSDWEFLNYDDPKVQEILQKTLEKYQTSEPEVVDEVTFENTIIFYFDLSCTACHNSTALSGGLDLSSYEGTLSGGNTGAGITVGDADGSMIVVRQTMDNDHYGQLSNEAIEIMRQWILDGALEK